MEQLLTVREVQDLLKIDRITVYRMLKDGRLVGVKVGAQWRFARPEIEALLAPGRSPDGAPAPAGGQVLPLHCAQLLQNVFADIAEVAAVTTTPDGDPLTTPSRPSTFCELIAASAGGRQACCAAWRGMGTQDGFVTCHAGLQSIAARIVVDGAPVATLIAGQFYLAPPDPSEEAARVARLARHYGIDRQTLGAAARAVPVLDAHKQARLGPWVASVAGTLAAMSRERMALLGRLRSIATLTSLEPAS